MKHRASLTLMELLVMVLVFALAAAVCLRCFAAAAVTARETDLQTRAALLAQNGAEILKASAGDLEKPEEHFFSRTAKSMSLYSKTVSILTKTATVL